MQIMRLKALGLLVQIGHGSETAVIMFGFGSHHTHCISL
jgi:hypothetical protein